MIHSLVIIFTQILKKAPSICCIFLNVINEVQAFSCIIFEKLKFFFSSIFLNIS